MERMIRLWAWIAITCVVVIGSPAQEGNRDPGRVKIEAPAPPNTEAAAAEDAGPRIGPGPLHAAIITVSETEATDVARRERGMIREIDYGGFRRFVFDERLGADPQVLRAKGVPIDDQGDLILVNGLPIDGAHPEAP